MTSFLNSRRLWAYPILARIGAGAAMVVNLYREYIALSGALLWLPSVKEGFPVAVMATPYALCRWLDMDFELHCPASYWRV